MELSIALLSYPLLLLATRFDYEVDLSTLRARQLQKMLVKLGYDRAEVNKIIDRSELRRLVEELLAEVKNTEQAEVFQKQLTWWTMALLGIASLYIIREPLKAIIRECFNWLRGYHYNLSVRCKLVLLCFENRFPLGTLALITAVILQILQPLVQLSILLSWVIPYNSY